MTYEKALKELKRQVELWHTDKDFVYKLEPLKMAVAALESRYPQKVLYIEGDYDFPLCPSCKMSVDENEEENYCTVCGQALDWSDDIHE